MHLLRLLLFGVAVAYGTWILRRWWRERRAVARRDPWRPELDNPLRQRAAAWLAARQQAAVDPAIDDAGIRGLVEVVLTDDGDGGDGGFARKQLGQLGERAEPFLFEGLRDPRAMRFRKPGDVWSGSGFADLLDLRESLTPCAELLPWLGTIAADAQSPHRTTALHAYGSLGRDECVAVLTRAFEDADEYVRSAAIQGVERAVRNGRATSGFRVLVFEALMPWVTGERDGSAEDAAGCLLELDRAGGMAHLCSKRVLRTDNPRLHEVLKALADAEAWAPAARVAEFLVHAEPRATEYPHTWVLGYSLLHLAGAGAPDAMRHAQTHLHHAESRVRGLAADALCLAAGIVKPRAFLYDTSKRRGDAPLSAPQRVFDRVFLLDADVRNGGFTQYLANQGGLHAREALAALREIGAREGARIIEELFALFGPAGPPQDQEEAADRMAEFDARKRDRVEVLEKQWYGDPDHVESLLALHAIAHGEHFGARARQG